MLLIKNALCLKGDQFMLHYTYNNILSVLKKQTCLYGLTTYCRLTELHLEECHILWTLFCLVFRFFPFCNYHKCQQCS